MMYRRYIVKLYLVDIVAVNIMPASWLTIYRRYTANQLADEIGKLKAQLDNPYESVTSGGKSATRNLENLAERLDKALRVQAERSGSFIDRTYADFRR